MLDDTFDTVEIRQSMSKTYRFENGTVSGTVSDTCGRGNSENSGITFNIFSSPEHEVLMVSYCDQSLSVVRALSTFCFKRLLLQNGLTDSEIILQEGSLGDPLPKLLKPFRSVEQDGRPRLGGLIHLWF